MGVTGQQEDGGGRQGKKARSGTMQDPSQQENGNDTEEGLEEKVDQSDLTEEEKRQMLDSLRGGGKGR
jgi:hypothetical protein